MVYNSDIEASEGRIKLHDPGGSYAKIERVVSETGARIGGKPCSGKEGCGALDYASASFTDKF